MNTTKRPTKDSGSNGPCLRKDDTAIGLRSESPHQSVKNNKQHKGHSYRIKTALGALAVAFALNSQPALAQTTPQNLYIYNSDIGLAYPGEGWDIGAYQYFPGAWIGVSLLFNPTAPLPYTASQNSDPLSLSIQTQHQQMAVVMSQQPMQTNAVCPYYDLLGTNFAAKIFVNTNSLYAFYFNGQFGTTNIKIADNVFTAGLQDQDYMRVTFPAPTNGELVGSFFSLPTNTNCFTLLYPGTPILGCVISPDGTKDLQIVYNPSYLASLQKSSPQNQTNVYNQLLSVLNGTTNISVFSGNISINDELIYIGNSNNAVYSGVLTNIQATMIHLPYLPPVNLRILNINGSLIWSKDKPHYFGRPRFK